MSVRHYILRRGAMGLAFLVCSLLLLSGLPALAGDGIDDRRTGGRPLPLMVVAVAAPSCAVADALTKVVAVDPGAAVGLLERCDATAWILRELSGVLRMRQLGSSSIVTVDAA